MELISHQRLFGRPSAIEPLSNQTMVYADDIGPFADWSGHPVQGGKSGVASIASLLCASGPAAVVRAIAEVVVDPVKLVLGAWRNAHVGKESREVIQPSRTDINASGAVFTKPGVVGVGAALNKHGPRPVLLRAGSLRRLAVLRKSLDQLLGLLASTALRVSGSKVVGVGNSCASAHAEALPKQLAIGPNGSHGGEASEGLISEVIFHAVDCMPNGVVKGA